ncbi:hypothetical protein Tco_1018554 [Tanacetum coccineum]|uniref:Reverse transcriptase domain-containing protein n=1 Tax=Tanacetum coccineum TaxID=301880 RepID=A0ABQ5FV13_9ASTR
MSKTRDGYGSGIARPKIDDKAHFELKGQFLKELRDNTFSDSDHEDANEYIEKVLEIVELFHIPEITHDHIMLSCFPLMSLLLAILFSRALVVPTNKFLIPGVAIPTMTAANAGIAIQEMAEHSQKWQDGMSTWTRITKEPTINGFCKFNQGIKQATIPFPSRLYDDCCDEEVGSYGLKELDAYSIRTTLLDDALPRKDKTYRALLYLVISIMTRQIKLFHTVTVKLGSIRTVKNPKGIAENVLVGIELRRNQVDDLEPTIEEGEVIDEPMMDRVETRSDNKIVDGLVNLLTSWEEPWDKVPRTQVVENMDSYRDEGMGDIIVGRPFCKEACIKANRFDEMITIGSVTMLTVFWEIMPPRIGQHECRRSMGRTMGEGLWPDLARGGGKTGRPIGRVGGRTGDQDGQGGGCSYKEFLACNPKDYDGKGGAIVYTRWIEKMESVQDMSGCGDNQKVKYTFSSFIGTND